MQDFEKLGLFYLGREYDLASSRRLDTPILYDARDLVTHAMCVGMTGSGKTGLCLSIVEEAAIDGIPVIAIDPKGDLGNLLLTFPDLAPADFRPWIDEDEARRAGLTPDAYAAKQAAAWVAGLAEWGQDKGRIDRLRQSAEFAIYTPGSRAGLPVSVLHSFAAPPAALRDDPELIGERAASTATSILTLAGGDAEPRSRDHTFISTILTAAWREGRDLDLGSLIQDVQSPSFQRVGVVDLEAFFPARERFDLAMQLNNVLAAPGFEQWFEGAPLDPGQLLHTADGRPRVVIFSIAHLGDAERMFFVSLLLHQVVTWMRGQSGTSSLRAVLYMDEIAGYFPPVANPPSKSPLLTLLKQGRAFGLGVVLATQNPVDLDYKGLANIGTWFLGRLQTERDKARVLDGLQGAAAGTLDRADVDRILSGLGLRVFLLHNVHERGPVVFQTRWTLSYLRGPLSKDQIRVLMSGSASDREQHPASQGQPASPAAAAGGTTRVKSAGADRARGDRAAPPVLPPGIQQVFIPGADGPGRAPDAGTVYLPVLLGAARVSFTDSKLGIDASRDVVYSVPVGGGPVAVDWQQAELLNLPVADLRHDPVPGIDAFGDLPPAAAKPAQYAMWQKDFGRWLAATQTIDLLRHRKSKLVSQADESERDFRIRVSDSLRAARDEAVDGIRQKYAAKQEALNDRLRRAEAAKAREAGQASQQKLQTAVSFGATLLGALLGRKAVSSGTLGRATTAARGVSRSMKESSDVDRAAENVDAVRQQLAALDDQLRKETQALAATFEEEAAFERVRLSPKRGQVNIQLVALAWDPRQPA